MNMFDGTGPHPHSFAPPPVNLPRVTRPAIATGFRTAYHAGEVNHCPSCNGTHWSVGRITADCAREGCNTALPLAEAKP